MPARFLITAALVLTACAEESRPLTAEEEFCQNRSCPQTMAEAIEGATSCTERDSPQMIVEMNDGTVCVGWFDAFGGSGTCYADGKLTSGIWYTDVIYDDERPSNGGFGNWPFCVWLAPIEGEPPDYCDTHPIANCLTCTNLDEVSCDDAKLRSFAALVADGGASTDAATTSLTQP